MANQTPFYKVGGNLSLNVPSYVTRPADQELFELAQQGQYCYVLTSRQMGKSSLMVRTARKLQQAGLKTATIDLTGLGNLTEETWYFDLMDELTEQLELSLDLETWWDAQGTVGLTRRFKKFLRDVVLVELSQPIVIFIDEIDFTLQLPFSDSFFVSIRALYNERATNPLFNRLTFILIGSATPSDFIKDPSSTPFNIGQAVMLGDIEYAQAIKLQQGLETVYPSQGHLIFERIYHWTDGHPYLSQKLCQEAINAHKTTWTPAQVDELVNQIFLSTSGQKESNLDFVRDKVLNNDQRAAMLKLYRRIYKGEKIAENSRDVSQSRLKLAGLVKPVNGQLYVRNQIYRQVFDKTWVNRYLEWNWGLIASSILGILLIVIILLGGGLYWHDSNIAEQAQKVEIAFLQPANYPAKQAESLATLFESQSYLSTQNYDYKAKELFFGLSKEQQLAIFNEPNSTTYPIAQGIYQHLADIDHNDNGIDLLQKIATPLANIEQTDKVKPLKTEIEAWLNGRDLRKQGQYQPAVAAYDQAIQLNNKNLATLYERADTLSQLQDYPAALNDLESIMAIAAQSALPTPTPAPTNITTVTSSSTPITIPTATATPTPRVTETSLATSTTTSTTLQPTERPTPPNQEILPVKAQLMNIAQIVEAVQILQIRYPGLSLMLAQTPAKTYPNLEDFGLVQNIGMVRIPAGEFIMGSDTGFDDEKPVHKVYLNDYFIDKYETTNAQYAECVKVGKCTAPHETKSFTWDSYYGNPEFANYPVINVDWTQAKAYCEFAGKRLPTEAEWEKAARGTDGRAYPWGNEFDGTKLNFCDKNCSFDWADKAVDDGYADTAPVGSYPKGASPYGVMDLAGNVWEWTSSDYKEYPYIANDGREDLILSNIKVSRGGGWGGNGGARVTSRSRDETTNWSDYVGGRCVR